MGSNVTGGMSRVLLRPVRVLRPAPPDEPEHDRDGLGRLRQVGHRQGADPPAEGRLRRGPLSSAIIDPKGEYAAARRRPRPAGRQAAARAARIGSTRWTPARRRRRRRRSSPAKRSPPSSSPACSAATCSPMEDAVLGWAVEQLSPHRRGVHARATCAPRSSTRPTSWCACPATPRSSWPGPPRRSRSRSTSCAPAPCAACSTAPPPSPSTGTTAPAWSSTCPPSTTTPRRCRW